MVHIAGYFRKHQTYGKSMILCEKCVMFLFCDVYRSSRLLKSPTVCVCVLYCILKKCANNNNNNVSIYARNNIFTLCGKDVLFYFQLKKNALKVQMLLIDVQCCLNVLVC